jgi:hypothetical protein
MMMPVTMPGTHQRRLLALQTSYCYPIVMRHLHVRTLMHADLEVTGLPLSPVPLIELPMAQAQPLLY